MFKSFIIYLAAIWTVYLMDLVILMSMLPVIGSGLPSPVTIKSLLKHTTSLIISNMITILGMIGEEFGISMWPRVFNISYGFV